VRPSPRALVSLIALSAALALLSLYQWMELLVVRAGGSAVCTFSEHVDCAQVWDSAFAGRVHQYTGLPIAALGLEWSLTALVLCLWLTQRTLAAGATTLIESALKIWSAIGFLSCISFAVASARIGAICPTCVLTYALTTALAIAAFRWLPPGALLLKSAPYAIAIAALLHLMLLYPGQHTPRSTPTELTHGVTEAQVTDYFARLTPPERDATREARKKWLEASPPEFPAPATRVRWGPADAPVKLVEFTDILCSHCRALVASLAEMRKVLPPGKLSIEARYFPLDGECNPKAGPPRGDGIRCLAAKAQICLESQKDFWELHDALFEHQAELDKEKILEIASSGTMKRDELEKCIAAPETATRLATDIAWAEAYGADGTPLVLLNGRETWPVPSFIFGMAMSGGDANVKWFQ
jgi:protein-disulfide isomerase/uncharacterized membrane protein